jgi:hypothetical protein
MNTPLNTFFSLEPTELALLFPIASIEFIVELIPWTLPPMDELSGRPVRAETPPG